MIYNIRKIKLVIVTFLVLILFLSCVSTYFFNEISFVIAKKQYLENDENIVFYYLGHKYGLDIEDENLINDNDGYILLKYSDQKKIFFIFPKFGNEIDVSLSKIIVIGEIDEYFKTNYSYSNVSLSFHVEYDTAPHKNITDITFSGNIDVDKGNGEILLLEIKNGRARFGHIDS